MSKQRALTQEQFNEISATAAVGVIAQRLLALAREPSSVSVRQARLASWRDLHTHAAERLNANVSKAHQTEEQESAGEVPAVPARPRRSKKITLPETPPLTVVNPE